MSFSPKTACIISEGEIRIDVRSKVSETVLKIIRYSFYAIYFGILRWVTWSSLNVLMSYLASRVSAPFGGVLGKGWGGGWVS